MLEQFPQPLKEARRWVCFDAAKTPINPATGKNAMPNEPSTWGTLAAAQAAVTRYGLRGVGVLLGDGLCGIDIDHCRDPATGALSDMAVQIIARMDSYTEASPSGTGVHILFTGTKPAGPCRKSSIGLEMYDGGRYFTVTGNVLEAKAIAERTEACAVSGQARTRRHARPGCGVAGRGPLRRGDPAHCLQRQRRGALCGPVCRQLAGLLRQPQRGGSELLQPAGLLVRR